MFKSQYQVAKFLRTLSYNSYDNISEEQAKNLEGFVIGNFDDSDYQSLTYTGVEVFAGMDDSMVGKTAYNKSTRPVLTQLAYSSKLPTYVEEDLAESAYLAEKVAGMLARQAEFKKEGKKYAGFDNFIISKSIDKFFI